MRHVFHEILNENWRTSATYFAGNQSIFHRLIMLWGVWSLGCKSINGVISTSYRPNIGLDILHSMCCPTSALFSLRKAFVPFLSYDKHASKQCDYWYSFMEFLKLWRLFTIKIISKGSCKIRKALTILTGPVSSPTFPKIFQLKFLERLRSHVALKDVYLS